MLYKEKSKCDAVSAVATVVVLFSLQIVVGCNNQEKISKQQVDDVIVLESASGVWILSDVVSYTPRSRMASPNIVRTVVRSSVIFIDTAGHMVSTVYTPAQYNLEPLTSHFSFWCAKGESLYLFQPQSIGSGPRSVVIVDGMIQQLDIQKIASDLGCTKMEMSSDDEIKSMFECCKVTESTQVLFSGAPFSMKANINPLHHDITIHAPSGESVEMVIESDDGSWSHRVELLREV